MIIEITINTNELTDHDRQILAFLSGSSDLVLKPSDAVKEEEKTTKRPPAKPVATRKPEPEPDDAVEEEAPKAKAPAKAPAKAKPAEDGPTMADAVEAATKLVSSGKTAEVKAALQAQGVRRVSELKDADQIAAFLDAVSTL